MVRQARWRQRRMAIDGPGRGGGRGRRLVGALIWQATKFLAAFALVVFLAAVTSRLLAQRTRGGTSAVFRIIGGLGLGGGRSLAAVQVGRRILVLGLGDKSVGLLATLDDADEVDRLAGPPPGSQDPFGPAGTAFAKLLRGAVERVSRRA